MRKVLAWLLLFCLACPAALAAEPTAPPRKVVYLTFDDAPTELTPALIAMLQSLNVPGTFFMVGRYIERRPEGARLIRDAGMAMASHSYEHRTTQLGDKRSFLRDAQNFQRALDDALGEPYPIHLFRFPYGSTWATPSLKRWVSDSLRMTWVDWNALNNDAIAGDASNPQRMVEIALASGGSRDEIVLLMHDGKPHTIATLPLLVANYKSRGYSFDILTPDFHSIPSVNIGLAPKPANVTRLLKK